MQATTTLAAPAPPVPLNAFMSQKLRFWSLVAMVLLVYVHAYNLHSRYLQPWTPVDEPLSAGTWLQYFLANGLLRFRIPILFAISGYLFAHHDGSAPHKVRVKRRVRTLLLRWLLIQVPFQLWFLRSLLVYNLAYPWMRRALERAPKVYFGIAGLMWLMGFGIPPFF
ncbi:hypothetical protein [Hymenobacter tenuis]